jgi:hypothetical protein
MNQLPLDVTLDKHLIENIHKSTPFVREIVNNFMVSDKMNIFDYHLFGMITSNFLLKHLLYNDYVKFVKRYNETMFTEYKEPNEFFRQAYTQLALRKGLFISVPPNLTLKDVTNIFKNNEFVRENDLETTLFNSLKDWDDKWIVKRQQHIGKGKSDISIINGKDKLVFELKKTSAKRKDVFQVLEYTANNSGYLPILIASDFDDDVIDLANKLNVNCYRYSLGTLYGDLIPTTVFLDPVNNARDKTETEISIEEINYCDGHLIEFCKPIPIGEILETSQKITSNFISVLEELIKLANR